MKLLGIAASLCISLSLLAVANGAEDPMSKKVKLPRRLMLSTEVLEEIYLQTGTKYAFASGALVRQVDTTQFGGEATVKQAAEKLAPEVSTFGGLLVLSSSLSAAELKKLTAGLTATRAAGRRGACYRLGRSGSVKAVEPLLRALSDKDESVRHHALRSLMYLHRGHHKEPEAYRAGRVSITRAAGKLPVRTLLGFLKKANDPAENEWMWAAELLLQSPSKAARTELAKAGKHGYAPVRALVALATEKKHIEIKPASRMLERQEALMKRALSGLASRSAYQRAEAARRVAACNVAGAEGVLAALKKEKDAGVWGELLLALGRKGGKASWDLVLAELKNTDRVANIFAIRALSRCPDARAVAPLMQIMTGPGTNGEQRFHAAVSLGMIGSDDVVKTLSEYVAATKMPLSITGLALGYIATPETEAALIKCVSTKKDPLKYYAYTGLARVGTKKAVDTLAKYHNEYDNTSRFCGHSVIRRVRNQEGIDRFIEVTDPGRGKIAPHGLEEADDPRAADALIARAEKGGGRFIFCVQALGRNGDPRCAAALTKLMNDHRNEGVRWLAMRALRLRWYWSRPEVQAAFKAHPVFKHFVEKHLPASQQPENTWVCRKWPIDFDDYRCVNTSYEAGMVFDGASGKALKWGAHGQRCDVPQLNETWLYDVASNTWTEKHSPVKPVGMCGTWGLSFDESQGKVMSMRGYGGGHGWQWGRGKSLRQSVPWVYDSVKDRWVPVRPTSNPGSRGFTSLAYVKPYQVHVIAGGQGGARKGSQNVWVYDMYANKWHMLPVGEPFPGRRAHETTLYMDNVKKIYFRGGSYGASKKDHGTWIYDLATNTWKNARDDSRKDVPVGHKPVEYDPVSGNVLAFLTHMGRAAAVWSYDPVKNKYRKLPAAKGPSPHHDSVDMCYDPANNVFVLDGGHTGWETDHIAVREVWTYKHVNRELAESAFDGPPRDLKIAIRRGKARLSWKQVKGAAGYNVFRGEGTLPWKIKYSKITAAPLTRAEFRDPTVLPTGGKKLAFYYVVPVDKAGKAGASSFKVRTQPAIPQELVVSVMANRSVELAWKKSPEKDVVGYHVYATAAAPRKRLVTNCIEMDSGWQRLTTRPVKKAKFVDKRKLAATEGAFGHEVRNYQVRAVNSLGIESGPSARGFTLTSSVPSVAVRANTDGSATITWARSPEQGILGYVVYRLEEVRNSAVVRLNAHPLKTLSFTDRAETPRAERRRYYVVAVDALGQEGMPSSGAWLFGRP
jgi:HEAT repeat protein